MDELIKQCRPGYRRRLLLPILVRAIMEQGFAKKSGLHGGSEAKSDGVAG